MNPKFSPLFQPYTFNNNVSVKNRLAVAPMTHWSSDDNGQATQAELDFIASRAKGFGIFINAATAVTWNSRAFKGEPNAVADQDIPSLAKRAEAVKKQGALAVLQLHHGGLQALPDEINGEKIIAPSATDKAEEITEAEIRRVIAAFGEATKRAIAAGFDGVEIHGANGYLLQQFVSAATNRRQDQWGGTIENRLRFSLAVTDAVVNARAQMNRPDFIIGYRFTPEEAGENGITMADTFALTDALCERPIQYLHMSLQGFHNKVRRGADTNLARMEALRNRMRANEKTDIALIGVGKLATPNLALDAFNTGWADFVAMGMGVLANPNFVELIETGKEEKARKMINLIKGAKGNQMPQPMWDFMMGFVPKPVVAVTGFIGKILGYQ